MTDKKQSAVARRLADKYGTNAQDSATNNDNVVKNLVGTLESKVTSIESSLPIIASQASYSNKQIKTNLEPTNVTGWEYRITELENNPQGGGGGIDPSDPTQPVIIVDNFINLNNGDYGQGVTPYAYPIVSPTAFNNFNFTVSGAAASEADHLGILELEPFESVVCGFAIGPDAGLPVLRFIDLNSTTIIIRTAGIKDNFFRFGLNNDVASSPPVDGVYFELLNGDPNFFAVTRDNNTQTRTDTGVAWVANTWYTLTITKDANNNPKFTINTTDITNTTNIPTEFLNLGISVLRSVTNNTTYDLDFFSVKIGDDPVASLPTGVTVQGTANEVDVGLASNVYTIGLPDAINIDQINFDTTITAPVLAEGQLSWDSNYETLDLGMGGGVTAQLGQSIYKRVRNGTATQIDKGNVVYVKGAHGQSIITVEEADASLEATAAGTLGVAAMDIPGNGEGWVITQGYLRGINTGSFSAPADEGKTVWLSTTTGEMTLTRPIAPNHGVVVGYLVKSAGSGAGSVFVKVANGQETDELHDVYINKQTIANFDILRWNSSTSRFEVANAQKIFNLPAARLVGRWFGAGTGSLQEVTIGTGLDLSNTGVLSSKSLVSDSLTLTAGTGLTGGGDLTQNRSFSVNFAANGEVSSVKAVRADDSRLSGLAPSTGLFDIDGGDSTVYTGTPILDGGVA